MVAQYEYSQPKNRLFSPYFTIQTIIHNKLELISFSRHSLTLWNALQIQSFNSLIPSYIQCKGYVSDGNVFRTKTTKPTSY